MEEIIIFEDDDGNDEDGCRLVRTYYGCPECGKVIYKRVSECPRCGVKLRYAE